MELAYTPEQVRLRKEIRAYFDDLMTPEVEAEVAQGETGGPACLEAVRKMGRDGWLGIGCPKVCRGRNIATVAGRRRDCRTGRHRGAGRAIVSLVGRLRGIPRVPADFAAWWGGCPGVERGDESDPFTAAFGEVIRSNAHAAAVEGLCRVAWPSVGYAAIVQLTVRSFCARSWRIIAFDRPGFA